MQLITLDFETYYDSDYSLRKLTTEEYLHDLRFCPIGVSVAIGNEAPHWQPFTTDDEFAEYLHSLDLPNNVLLCHNALFDGAILAWRYRIVPKVYFDTLSMARPLHGAVVGGSLSALARHYQLGEKGTEVVNAKGKYPRDFTPAELAAYGDYCKQDVALTRTLFKRLRASIDDRELPLIDDTIRMFTSPRLGLDPVLLEHHLETVRTERETSLEEAGVAASDLNSAAKLADLLRQHGVEPPTKISPTTGKETFAFSKQDNEFTDLLDHPNDVVRALAAARLKVRSTIEERRTQRFIGIAERTALYAPDREPRLPVPLAFAGASTTWRWSGSQKVNLQNLPAGGNLRRAMVALGDDVLVGGDLSNIELRVTHCLAGRDVSRTAFATKRDLYVEFAAILFRKPESEITAKERKVGKVAHLSLGYGCGWRKFKHMARMAGIPLTDDEAQRIVTTWRETYSAIPALWRQADQSITAMHRQQRMVVGRETLDHDLVVTGSAPDGTPAFLLPRGRFIKYDQLSRDEEGGWRYKGRDGWKHLYGGAAVGNLCQSLARHILADQWLQFSDYLRQHAPGWQLVLQVHDELVACGPKAYAEPVAEALERIFCTPPIWWPTLPLTSEVHIGRTFADLK